jgi:hypothetical protein
MDIDHQMISDLRKKVEAATEEFEIAVAVHETWKLAAFDQALRARLGRSRAAATFHVVRGALRREFLLALTRLWDNDSSAIRMKSITNTLCDKRVVDALAAHCEAQWGNHQIGGQDDSQDLRKKEREYGRSKSKELRENVTKILDIVASYSEGGSRSAVLKNLKELRNERLAHRQVEPSTGTNSSSYGIETFYQHMATLIELLRSVVLHTSYNLEDVAGNHRRDGALFWGSVRGENTEGHPAYERQRRRRGPRQRHVKGA